MNPSWHHSNEIDKISPALTAVQTAGLFVVEDKDNRQVNSKYADLTSIWIKIQPILGKFGLSVLQPLGKIRSENGKFILALTTIIMHESGQWISGESEILVPTNEKLSAAWWAGSAQTYGRRYALVSMLGIITGEDDDGQTLQRNIARRDVEPVSISSFLPNVEGEWVRYAGEGWKNYRLDDGRLMGDLSDTEIRKTLQAVSASGGNPPHIRGYLWDVIGTRLEILKEKLTDALEARGFDGFVTPDEWDVADLRKVAACVFSDKKANASSAS